jgi:L-malate glycosyltransferase
MTLRVVHVASGREWRGGQKQVWLLARALARRGGVDQCVVTSAGSELGRRVAADHIPASTPGWTAALDPRALMALLRVGRRGGILHAHDGHALTLAGVAAALLGARLVVTRRVDFALRRTTFWQRADRVIAISDAVRAALMASGVPAHRIALVHSGIAVEEVAASRPRDPRPALGLPANTPLAVTTGALVAHKDHATMIEAAALAAADRPDLHWAIAGDGPVRPRLEDLIRELGVADRVHLLGHVADPAGLVKAAELFVMSSVEEGLGTSVLDAMALGVPVVATRAGGIPEMLEGGAGVLVPSRDSDALAAAVVRLIGAPEERSLLATRARKAVEMFSDRRMAEEVFRVYRSVTPAH